jgi:hypothetical protein
MVFDATKSSLPVCEAYRRFANEAIPYLTGRRQGRKPLSPNFTGAEMLEEAFEDELDISVASASVA